MSLINDLRNIDKPETPAQALFYPLWVRVVQRNGCYLISQSSLIDCAKEAREQGIDFDRWLERNGMQLFVLKNGFYSIRKK